MKEKDCSPDLVTYNLIIGGLLEQGEVDEVFNLKNEMVATGIKVDVETFICIIKGLCKLGEFKDVIKILGDDSILRDSLHIYNELIQRLLQCDKMHLAMELLSEIHKKELIPDCNTYSYLIFGFIDKGNEEKAHLLFNEMQQRNVCPNDVTFSKMLQTRLPSRRKILVKRWLQVMKKKEGVTLV
ncbi:putative pentatricopeptide repeat-containing protein [Tanacetum coccineum]